nr:hypothetical protein [Candidatus Odyssella thessalonicensis]
MLTQTNPAALPVPIKARPINATVRFSVQATAATPTIQAANEYRIILRAPNKSATIPTGSWAKA